MRRFRSAFTLIEMLTVIAITAVLLTIIVMPIFQSFNLTRAAQIFASAQSDARSLTEKISREISSAVSVRSGTTLVATTLNGNATNLPSHTLVVQLPGRLTGTSNPPVEVALPWTKIDILPAAQIGPGTGSGAYIDPITGKYDPTLKTFKGQVQTPVVPSTVMVRYYLALRDPELPYNDPYSGLLMAESGSRDNLVSLFRSVASEYAYTTKASVTTQVTNTALFATDSYGNPVLDDPRFMVMDSDATQTDKIARDSHNLRVYHWLGRSPTWENSIDTSDPNEHNASNFAHTVLQTQVSRFDMITPQYNLASRVVAYDNATNGSGTAIGLPRVTPLLQFKPTVISNDPAPGQEAIRPGEETDNAVAIAPDVYKTQYGLWSSAVVRTYPAGFNNSVTATNKYSIGYPSNASNIPGFSEFGYDPNASNASEFSTGIEYFDDYTYDNAVALVGTGTPYPFSQAVSAANSRSGWLSDTNVHNLFTPYDLIPGTGKIRASFDISEVGNTAATLPIETYEDPNRPNLPTILTPNIPIEATADTGTAYPWSPASATSGNPYDINSAYNLAFNSYPALQGSVQRFIDLRVTPNEDGTLSPLYPSTVSNQVTNFQISQPDGSMLNRCRIVPGSESVVGPDQTPGDNYGHPVRYVRVTSNPGMDQYRIVYTDQQEPNVANGATSQVTAAAYMAAFGLTSGQVSGFQVDTYDPTNFVSATLQARFKGGYVQLNSDPSQPLPQGYYPSGSTTLVPVPFKVDYRFQFTGVLPAASVGSGAARADTFAVDYDTRQLMQVLLTLRSLPQSNLPNPQTVTLKATATLKNVAR